MSNPYIFDRRRVKLHRDRAAAGFSEKDFLFREMAQRLGDRLSDFTRSFPRILDLGAHDGLLAEYLSGQGDELWVQTDLSGALIQKAKRLRVVADEEFLPFTQGAFDLVVSAGSLHWINDLPGMLIQTQRVLKPGGMFIAIMLGGETLKELRQAFEEAELALQGGISPRVSPFVDVRDAGSLLQRAGFEMPVTDSETLTVSYESPMALMDDLCGMGESNALVSSVKHCSHRDVIFAAADYYETHFSDAQGRITASFELVTMTGWKADAPRA